MSRQPKPSHVVFSILHIDCKAHGGHKVVIGGLDDLASLSALILRDALSAGGRSVQLREQRIPLDDARALADLGGINLDDVPF